MAVDCEQLLQQIDSNVRQLLDGGSNNELLEALDVIVDKLVEMDNRVIAMEENLVPILTNIKNTNVDTNSVSKAILNYLNKVQNFLKI